MDTTKADQLRGHDWLPGDGALAEIPALYVTQEDPLEDMVIYLHYYVGACHWWIAELDEDRRYAFDYVTLGDPNCAEWGDIDLDELRAIDGGSHAMPYWVERDIDWTREPFGQITTD